MVGRYDSSSPHVLIECAAAAEVAHNPVAGGWGANLTIPWSVYTHGGRGADSGMDATDRAAHRAGALLKAGRINFYRWDHGLAGGGANLSAWSVTQCDGHARCNPPHVPKYFGVARLLGRAVG